MTGEMVRGGSIRPVERVSPGAHNSRSIGHMATRGAGHNTSRQATARPRSKRSSTIACEANTPSGSSSACCGSVSHRGGSGSSSACCGSVSHRGGTDCTSANCHRCRNTVHSCRSWMSRRSSHGQSKATVAGGMIRRGSIRPSDGVSPSTHNRRRIGYLACSSASHSAGQ